MKYSFSLQTVCNAFDRLKNVTPNKFWGILSLLRSIDSNRLIVNQTYRIVDDSIGDWLNDTMSLVNQPPLNTNNCMYARFSVSWHEYVAEEILDKKPNIFDVIIFVNKYKTFSQVPQNEEMIGNFLNEYHLDAEYVNDWFSYDSSVLKFQESNHITREQLKSNLGVKNDTLTFEGEYSVKARASELSRAPFVQTLYAGLDSLKCLLISRDDLNILYPGTPKRPVWHKRSTKIVNQMFFTYLSAIRTKPFLLLAGISGTGKSRIVRRLAQATTTEALEKAYNKDFAEGNLEANRWNIHKPANFEIIQVKPNWHNSMDLVGYQTNIPEPHYVFMPFAEFIAKAWLHKDVPFFLCLDEMNLAPVEEYFAEFLSAIESRSKDGKNYETDPIIKPFETFGEKMANEMIDALLPKVEASKVAEYSDIVNRFKTKGLTLPENLIVIGTVNMDETTFSFSRKVLDRAMSFEMNEVDYDSFLQGEADIINKPLNDNEKALLTDRTIKAQEVASEIDADAVIGYLKAVNGVLDNTPFKLGYRAANEAMLYVSASRRFGQTSAATALDEFTLMKILSRIEGDEMKLKTDNGKSILDELEEVIKTRLKAENNAEEVEGEQQEEAQENAETPKQPAELKSLKKLTHMKKQLSNNHFVSYWE